MSHLSLLGSVGLLMGDFVAIAGTLGTILLLIGVAAVLVVKTLLYVCLPSEVLVFSGRSRRTADGKTAGYRIIRGGRALRVPLFETVDRMDLTNMIIEVQVRNAYSKGGIPLAIQGVANIKIPGTEPLLNNCLERFLGKTRPEIMQIARETLEGNLRGVLAKLTPEEVNEDKESFASQLTAEVLVDFHRLGLEMDTLKIQNVSDDVGYLDAIGRAISAKIIRDAKVAEARNKAQADEQKWVNTKNAEVAKLNAEIEIARRENDTRLADARSKRQAMIAHELAAVRELQAKAEAEVAMQDARIEQVRLQLKADVLQPAEAARREAEEAARGRASKIIEQGEATARVLEDIASRYRGAGDAGRDILLMQKLVPLLASVSGSMGDLKVDRLTVLGGGADAGEGERLASKLVRTSEEVKAATGIDLPETLRKRLSPT